MRLLHTSDWHMNDTLRHIDRSPDICRVLEQIAAYLQEYSVDVMLVTGDLFSERSRPEQMRQAIADLKRIFWPRSWDRPLGLNETLEKSATG